MTDYKKEAEEYLAAQRQKRALEAVKRACRIEQQNAALAAAIDSIKENAEKAKAGNFSPEEMAAKYTGILDGLFSHYLEKSKNIYNHDDMMAMALKTHQQAVRSLYIWHKLKS